MRLGNSILAVVIESRCEGFRGESMEEITSAELSKKIDHTGMGDGSTSKQTLSEEKINGGVLKGAVGGGEATVWGRQDGDTGAQIDCNLDVVKTQQVGSNPSKDHHGEEKEITDYGFAGSWADVPLPLDLSHLAGQVGISHASSTPVTVCDTAEEDTHYSFMPAQQNNEEVMIEASPEVKSDGVRSMGGDDAAIGREEVSNVDEKAPKEEVCLPEDVYGAARVSEYWHGLHGLTSLASPYVYNDIWASGGVFNTRCVL
ncbi:unnamed protein product [Discosporangium mesarthrocarpum]